MDDEPENLSDILMRLPDATPLFLPDEFLTAFFPPWIADGLVDPSCLKSAKQYGERFGCAFTHDSNMGEWCYIKSPLN